MCKKLRIAGFANDSVVDGVGLRFTVFVQGCPFACEGCHNAETQPFEGGTFHTPEKIFEMISENPLLDGVTFSGGEPFVQAEALLPLAKMIKQKGLHLASYTGFVFEKLISEKSPAGAKELLSYIDVLIDGPFVIGQRDIYLKFKGSKNQRVLNVKQSLAEEKAVLLDDERWD